MALFSARRYDAPMAKFWMPICLAAFALTLNGCGGSGSGSSTPTIDPASGTILPEYTANLPDGSPMELEIMHEGDGVISGTFAVAAVTGPYAFQTGIFEGSVAGGTVDLDCEMSDGTEFTMTGTQSGSGLRLTRSDIAGTVLNFVVQAPNPDFVLNTRAEASFLITTGGTNGRATISTTPFSVQGGGVLTEYRGTWQGVPVTFWAYNNGAANIVLYVDPLALDSITFASYKLSDLSTATVSTTSAQISAYSSTTRSIFKFKHSVTCSP